MNRTQIFGTHEENTLAQFKDVANGAERAALMADGHLGYVMPIGGVAAYQGKVSVTWVGFDIACGNATIRTDLVAEKIAPHAEDIADEIAARISFGVGGSNSDDEAPVDDPLFSDPAWEALPRGADTHGLKNKARAQLGTIGSGNHYVNIFADDDGVVWVGVHFGSRGFGHTVASGFLSLSRGELWGRRTKEVEVLLDLDTPLGDAYWSLMNLAGRYAYAGREWVARKVVSILGGVEQELVHNHHNFAWKEEHGGERYVVVRKGATPAFPGQRGFVGGSMGDDSVILEGKDGPHARAALHSTVHGAGRVMSRMEAGGKYKGWGPKRKLVRPGKVSPEMMREWVVEGRGVILRGGGLDESPHAYRRLPDVLKAQGDTIRVLYTLRPLIVCMAGASSRAQNKGGLRG